MGAGAINGHSTNRGNQVYPSPRAREFTSADNHVPTSSQSLPSVSQTPAPIATMSKVQSCETCDNNFSLFKRRKICKDCRRVFCSTCLPKPPSNLAQNGRQCQKCTILTSGKFTRAQLQAWRVKDMRCFLDTRNIPTSTCKEKHDLIDLLLMHFCLESTSALNEQQEHDRLVGELADRMRNSSFYMSPSLPHQVPDPDDNTPPSSPGFLMAPPEQTTDSTRQAEILVGVVGGDEDDDMVDEMSNLQSILTGHLRDRQQREMREAMERLQEELGQEEPESRPGIQRATIDDVQSQEDVENLTVRQLKEILVNNFVDYKGCVEKHELVDRVKRLWVETQANKER
ncbi:hypothetical protein BaRGS_00030536, partial [Batillaria attramentaria]